MQISFDIGKTKRHLATRVGEHRHSSSAVHEHLDSCEGCRENFSCDLFKILDSGRNDLEITIKEALYIKAHKPIFNRQLHTQGSSFIVSIF